MIKCPYCDATAPQPDTQSCGCGATVFDKPEDPTHTGKNYSRALLQGANFRNQDLRNADFSRALLQGADFAGADLRGADFSRSILQGANLQGARTDGAKFERALMQGIRR